jgi:hypothetical protein
MSRHTLIPSHRLTDASTMRRIVDIFNQVDGVLHTTPVDYKWVNCAVFLQKRYMDYFQQFVKHYYRKDDLCWMRDTLGLSNVFCAIL